jgi:hypothetical protein
VSLIRAIKAQLGLSTTPAHNFTWDSSADDGTAKLARGNADATIHDVMTVDAADNVNFRRDVSSRGRHLAVNYDTLVLNVAPTGSANPATPVGDGVGSGDPFNNLSSLVAWVGNRVNVRGLLTINIAAGTYNEPSTITFKSSTSGIRFVGAGKASTVIAFQPGAYLHFSGCGAEMHGLTISANVLQFSGGGYFGVAADFRLNGALIFERGSIFAGGNNKLNMEVNTAAGSHSIYFNGASFDFVDTTPRVNLVGAVKNVNFVNSSAFYSPLVNTTTLPGAVITFNNKQITNSYSWFRDSQSGMIFMSGNGSRAGAQGTTTVTFPVAFPTACVSVIVGNMVNNTGANLNYGVDNDRVTLANFPLTAEGTSAIWAYRWFAVGY